MTKRLKNKTALVTGASRGIGQGIVLGLAEEGADIIMPVRDVDSVDKISTDIEKTGSRCTIIACDLSKENQIVEMFQKVRDNYENLDILINCARATTKDSIFDFSTSDWDNDLSINLRAPFICTREAMKMMKNQGGGRIINIGSTSGKRVKPGKVAYSVSKFGLTGLTHVTALEGRDFGITCCCIHPGKVASQGPGNTTRKTNPPSLRITDIVKTIIFVATLAPEVELLETIIIHRDQPFIGRG